MKLQRESSRRPRAPHGVGRSQRHRKLAPARFLHRLRSGRRSERASAVLVILVLVAGMVIFALSNTATLDTLKQELKFIDQRQQEKYGQGPGH